MLWRPVEEGMWTHRDIIENVFTIYDLMDAHEYLDTKADNMAAARRWADAHR